MMAKIMYPLTSEEFNERFMVMVNVFYEIVSRFIKAIAGLFGYPKNPGMPVFFDRTQFDPSLRLPLHKTEWPPIQKPETWFELIFGTIPKMEVIPRHTYESKNEGFYNFYVENYRNTFLLPDKVSEFIQIKLNICLDIGILEAAREGLFLIVLIFTQLLLLRIALTWFLAINPYVFPWYFLGAIVDWAEEFFHGMVPVLLGMNVTVSLFLVSLGAIADALNHLVFTMPFLPSEGEKMKFLINEQVKDVLVFHYLPVLWYRYPIPNEIREFWYKKRPDILEYMEKAYKDLDIQFLPDNIINDLDHQELAVKLSSIYDFLITQDTIPIDFS